MIRGFLDQEPNVEAACDRLNANAGRSHAEVKTFYRVNHKVTCQGLWYDFDGNFTGLIHGEFSFCKNTNLAMDFDPSIVGYVSVVETLEQLFQWFTPDDILKLQEYGWYAYEYRSDDYRWYERFGHFVAKQSSLASKRQIVLDPESEIERMTTEKTVNL